MDKIHYKLALPRDVKEWVEIRAAKNLRSQSATIIHIIKEKMEAENQATKRERDLEAEEKAA